jgi:hypothetical protein
VVLTGFPSSSTLPARPATVPATPAIQDAARAVLLSCAAVAAAVAADRLAAAKTLAYKYSRRDSDNLTKLQHQHPTALRSTVYVQSYAICAHLATHPAPTTTKIMWESVALRLDRVLEPYLLAACLCSAECPKTPESLEECRASGCPHLCRAYCYRSVECSDSETHRLPEQTLLVTNGFSMSTDRTRHLGLGYRF